MLYNKWWKGGANVCPKTDYDPSKASALNVVNIGGIFVVLLCGLTFAILVAIMEFCLKVNMEKEVHPVQVGLAATKDKILVPESHWLLEGVWWSLYRMETIQKYVTISVTFYGKQGTMPGQPTASADSH